MTFFIRAKHHCGRYLYMYDTDGTLNMQASHTALMATAFDLRSANQICSLANRMIPEQFWPIFGLKGPWQLLPAETATLIIPEAFRSKTDE